jgi:hypothetical protein
MHNTNAYTTSSILKWHDLYVGKTVNFRGACTATVIELGYNLGAMLDKYRTYLPLSVYGGDGWFDFDAGTMLVAVQYADYKVMIYDASKFDKSGTYITK